MKDSHIHSPNLGKSLYLNDTIQNAPIVQLRFDIRVILLKYDTYSSKRLSICKEKMRMYIRFITKLINSKIGMATKSWWDYAFIHHMFIYNWLSSYTLNHMFIYNWLSSYTLKQWSAYWRYNKWYLCWFNRHHCYCFLLPEEESTE